MLLPGQRGAGDNLTGKGVAGESKQKPGRKGVGGGERSRFSPWRGGKPSQQKVRCSWKPRCTMTLLSVTFVPMVFRPFAVNCVLPVKDCFHSSFLSQCLCSFLVNA